MNMSKDVDTIKFDEPREWMIGGRKIKVSKLETKTIFEPKPGTKRRFADLDPNDLVKNVVKNVALMDNGVFLERDAKTLIARINDVDGKSLIRTQWIISFDTFNNIAAWLMYHKQVPEHKFHITSKIS